MENKTNKKALASIILGIISIVLAPTIIVGIVCGILAIVFGCIGKKDVTETNQSNKGFGIGGIITGSLGLAISVIIVVVLVTILSSPFMLSRTDRFLYNFENIMKENVDPNFSFENANDIMENNVNKEFVNKVGVNNKCKELYDQGYENNMISITEGNLKTLFVKDNSYIVAKANISDEQYEQLDSITFDDENYDELRRMFILSLDNVELEDVSNKVPTQDELNKYVSKTIGDLENEGFYQYGYDVSEDKIVLTYSNDVIIVDATIKNTNKLTDFEDISDKDRKAMIIEEISLNSVDFGIMD